MSRRQASLVVLVLLCSGCAPGPSVEPPAADLSLADAEIVVTPSNDPRSYRLNSQKLLATGFQPKKCVDDAIREIVWAFERGEIADTEQCYNVKWMQRAVRHAA